MRPGAGCDNHSIHQGICIQSCNLLLGHLDPQDNGEREGNMVANDVLFSTQTSFVCSLWSGIMATCSASTFFVLFCFGKTANDLWQNFPKCHKSCVN